MALIPTSDELSDRTDHGSSPTFHSLIPTPSASLIVFDGRVVDCDEDPYGLLQVSNSRSLGSVSSRFGWAMYTSEFGLAMWRPSEVNVGDIGYFRGGEFIPLGANIFDAPFSFASPGGITVLERADASGGVRCVPIASSRRESAVLPEQR
jgi:hypothetical protein